MVRAVVKSAVSGWLVVVSIPSEMAEAPVRSSVAQWAAGAFGALVLTIAAAWWFGRTLEQPLRDASEEAAALGRGEPLAPLDSAVVEADRIVAALADDETCLAR